MHLNDHRGKLIISALVSNGVDTFLVAPGSRSTPLVLAAGEHPAVKTIVHFDERGIAFHALGIAKARQAPVVVICTSGTAVVNLYPAIVEASLDHIPLIFLTADRPFELRGCGANQAIDQVKIFGSYLRFEADVPCPDGITPDEAIVGMIDEACYKSCFNDPGPVVLNCMFREPFSTYEPNKAFPTISLRTKYHAPIKTVSLRTLETLAESLPEEGVILAGSMPYSPDLAAILSLAEKLQWPVIADPLSHLRSFGEHPCILTHYNHILPNSDFAPKTVLHFGGALVSKIVQTWVKELDFHNYIHVSEFTTRHDPFHQVTERVEMAPHLFAQMLPVEQREPRYLSEHSERMKELLREELLSSSELTEPLAVFSLIEYANPETLFFFANSLSIRYADSFFFPKGKCGPMYGNRGASGIDGNIATIAGLAEASGKPVIAVLGDFSFLHDLNSLALLCNPKLNVTLIILNNQGGGIFRFLPIGTSPHLEKFFVAKHPFAIEPFVKAFYLPYTSITSREELRSFMEKRRGERGVHVVEIPSDVEENYLLMQGLKEKAAECFTLTKPL